MKKNSIWMPIAAVILIVISISCINKGFDCKDNYYNSEEYAILNQNAYVGGDAYNFIINGTYFTGYSVLGGASGLGAIILLCSYFNILNHDKLIEKIVSKNSSKDEKVNVVQRCENTYNEPDVSTDSKPTLWSNDSSTLIVPEQEDQ